MNVFPQFERTISFEPYTKEQFLVIAVQVAAKLNWDIVDLNSHSLELKTPFSMRSWFELFSIEMREEDVLIRSVCSRYQKMDWGKNKKNVEDFLRVFETYTKSLNAEKLAGIGPDQLENLIRSVEQKRANEVEEIQEYSESIPSSFGLIPKKGYFVTPVIIYLNVAVFVLMALTGVSIMDPTGEDLIKWGANIRIQTLDDQWWRLLTATFLHIGIIHLLLNMYALYYIGVLLEPLLRSTRFALVYLVSGILASVSSLWFHEHTASAGASGAIFGMFGFFLVLIIGKAVPRAMRMQLLLSVGVFIFYNLVSGLKGGIDNAAHIGGLVTGAVMGLFLITDIKRKSKEEFVGIGTKDIIMTVSLFLLIVLAIRRIPNDMPDYERNMEQIQAIEEKALQALYVSENASMRTKEKAFVDNGIGNWEKMNELLLSNEKLEIPGHLKAHNELLIDYAFSRRKTYEFYWRNVRENTNDYNDSIDHYNEKVSFYLMLLKTEVE